jgi:hypothetical protein
MWLADFAAITGGKESTLQPTRLELPVDALWVEHQMRRY